MAHTKNMKIIKKYNLLLFIPLIIIMIISFLNMQNAKLINITYNHHLIKQIMWYFVGLTSILIMRKLNLHKLFDYSFYLYLFSCLLLVLVLILGKNIHGAKAWFTIGPLSFQPSELVKLTLSLYLANFISKFPIHNKKDELR